MRAIEKLAKLRLSEIALSRFERIAARMGVDEKRVLELYVEAKNNAGRDRFAKTIYSERILLLPQCLRSRDCPAKPSEYGYQCINCGRCKLGLLIIEAEALGYKKAMIISGGSIVPKALIRLKPKVCLAAGCLKELVMGSFVCEKFGIVGQGLPLLRDGCLETDLDWNLLRNFLYKHMSIVTA
jgi:hypothetical protein